MFVCFRPWNHFVQLFKCLKILERKNMISFIFEAEQNFTSSMVAMWCTSSAQFTNSNIEHIWKDSQLIHTENIYALLGGFWHGRSFSGTGGEAKFVWCARHTWSLTLEPSAAVMSSSSLCYWGVGTFSTVLGFCFCSQADWKQFLACVLPQGQKAGVGVAWRLWPGCDVTLALSLGQNWFQNPFRPGEIEARLTISSCFLKDILTRLGNYSVAEKGRRGRVPKCR